jgi:putative sporulation protein YtxC
MDYFLSIPQRDPDIITKLRRRLSALIIYLRELGLYCWYEEYESKVRHFFYWQTVNHGEKANKRIRKELGKVLASFICEVEEPFVIRKMIQKMLPFPYRPDVMQIEARARQTLEKSNYQLTPDLSSVDYRDVLGEQIAVFLSQNSQLALDGYVCFRMGSRRKEMTNFIKQEIEDYLLNKEYKEFIQLLRYFVSVQTSRIALVHVIHLGKKRFQLLHADGFPLKIKDVDGVWQEVAEQTASCEDFIVSTLLTIAPERVILHTKYPEENVIRTLLQIFEGRIMVCHGCNECELSINFTEDA